jgi:Domain of unknown function (DUF1839)
MIAAAPQLPAAPAYVRHALHQGERPWPETNCFVDLWIEVLHAFGHDPLAALGCTLDLDFEGDQFTFFKQTYADLSLLHGADVQELNVWRPLHLHLEEFLRRRRLVLTEADAHWLPDTAGTDYRSQHTKTTIAIQAIDVPGERLGYFHNAGYHELQGADFRSLFGLDAPPDPSRLPLYCEFLRLESLRQLPRERLLPLALECTRGHFRRRPRENPVARFASTFPEAVARLGPDALGTYHQYAFATVRQLGSAADLGAHHLRWLQPAVRSSLAPAAAALEAVSLGGKSLILKGARAVSTGKRADFGPLLDEMSSGWGSAMELLAGALGD